jgi:dienelactone hydrolase
MLLTPTFSPTAIDPTFPVESRRRAEDILDEIKATYHVQIFGGVEHGFATRGDPSVEVIRESTFVFDRSEQF